MKILAIESASLTASAALLTETGVVSEYAASVKKTHSETLLPMVKTVLDMAGVSLGDVDAIAVSEGPGSFTGLRIGASIAKGLAFSVSKPIVPVPTLDAMAYGFTGSSCMICPILDARRGEVYTGLYQFEGERFTVIHEGTARPLSEEIQVAKQAAETYGKKVLFTGDGLNVHEETIRSEFPEALIAPPHMRFQRAAYVASLGQVLYAKGRIRTAETFLPVYFRMSQAERERTEQGLSIAPGEGPDIAPENKSIPGVLSV